VQVPFFVMFLGIYGFGEKNLLFFVEINIAGYVLLLYIFVVVFRNYPNRANGI
jgi:hypothetical protein